MKTSIALLVLMLLTKNSFTQLVLRSIDENKLLHIIERNKEEYPYQVVFIFTNKCIGTKYLMEKIKFLKQQPIKKTNFLLCCSSRMKDSSQTKRIIAEANIGMDTVYLIDKHRYKEKLTDDRYKGFLFRMDICPQCVKDEIGVPYTIVYNAQGEIIKFGYLGRDELLITLKE